MTDLVDALLKDHNAIHALADTLAPELLGNPGFVAAMDLKLVERRKLIASFEGMQVEVSDKEWANTVYSAVFHPGEVPQGVPRYIVYIRDESGTYHPVMDARALHPGVIPAMDANADLLEGRASVLYISLINPPELTSPEG